MEHKGLGHVALVAVLSAAVGVFVGFLLARGLVGQAVVQTPQQVMVPTVDLGFFEVVF